MPLVINGGRGPDHWAQRDHSGQERNSLNGASAVRNGLPAAGAVNIALINNMPDAALEDTEEQFFSLLEAAADELPVHVQLFYLPDVPRGERVQQHVRNYYLPAAELWNHKLDGAIITGTEPRQRDLRQEPYWDTLTSVFDWAEEHTTSTVLSCLAAHASVLHSDGIERNPLADKQFGVFEYQRSGKHVLTDGLPHVVRFPHSRWNEVREGDLTAHGYDVLDGSADAGVNLFAKNKGNSLFVHFQGHPEYHSRTLLKEYRRDVRRFLKQERGTYPSMPKGYFGDEACALLQEFRHLAETQSNEEAMSAFPEARLTDSLQNTWGIAAAHIYRNWLQYMLSGKTAVLPLSPLTSEVRV
jgi:homoserine O-succinyltransferase/O-acetyltransferase